MYLITIGRRGSARLYRRLTTTVTLRGGVKQPISFYVRTESIPGGTPPSRIRVKMTSPLAP